MILSVAYSIGAISSIGGILGAFNFIGVSVFHYSCSYINYKSICETAGIVFKNATQVQDFETETAKVGMCQGIPTEHCADTEVWREDLIKAAEHNIVLSGNYCGGKSFSNLLKLIEEQMKTKDDLKVIIISSPNFVKNGNLTFIKKLLRTYPKQFSFVKSPDIWHVSTGLKKSTNHTKCLVIDYGKYFILGGSGVKDNFAETGLDDLTKQEFLDKRETERRAIVKNEPTVRSGSLLQSTQGVTPLESRVGLKQDNQTDDEGVYKYFIPGNFRDMDFVFKCQGGENSSGEQVYKQMLLLSYRWEQYNQMLKERYNQEPSGKKSLIDANGLGVFTRAQTEISSDDSVVLQLLKTPIPQTCEILTRIPVFDENTKKSSNILFQILASGPEHTSSKFALKLEKAIAEAKKFIVINHMYFHPTQTIMNELIKAANRGVKIKIITSGVYKNCPNSHYAFGPRNKYNYASLVRALSEDKKEHIEIYEYQQNKKGNHKKVIVIDDQVIAGSSNLGYKSLVSTSDHELNFFAKSDELVRETLKICDIDIEHSLKIENPTHLTVADLFQAVNHYLLAPLIG